MRKLLAVAVVALVPSLAVAAAKSGDDLGDRGVISPFGSISLTYAKNDSSGGVSGASLTTFTFAPGVLYFVIDDLAVGGNVVLATSKPGDQDATTTIGIGPEAAYHVRFNDTWSLLPLLSLDLTRTSLPDRGRTGSTTDVTFALSVYAPVLLRVSHFYMGFGPFLSRDLYRHAGGVDVVKSTSIGLASTLGGWL